MFVVVVFARRCRHCRRLLLPTLSSTSKLLVRLSKLLLSFVVPLAVVVVVAVAVVVVVVVVVERQACCCRSSCHGRCRSSPCCHNKRRSRSIVMLSVFFKLSLSSKLLPTVSLRLLFCLWPPLYEILLAFSYTKHVFVKCPARHKCVFADDVTHCG